MKYDWDNVGTCSMDFANSIDAKSIIDDAFGKEVRTMEYCVKCGRKYLVRCICEEETSFIDVYIKRLQRIRALTDASERKVKAAKAVHAAPSQV
jgi:hypothetical protein